MMTLEQAVRSNKRRVHHQTDIEQTTMIGEHLQSKSSEKPLDRQRAGADVRARGAGAAGSFGINTPAMVRATVDHHCR